MLAKPGSPFDSNDYLFEIKWDGTRTLAFIDQSGYRLLNRRHIDMVDRYPEFAFLKKLPAGTILDGEVVVLSQGKPSFQSLMSREQSRSPLKIRSLARNLPATYIVFDLLYEGFQSIMDEPLVIRRDKLRSLVKKCNQPYLILSEGVVGQGKAFFQQVTGQDMEGVIASACRVDTCPINGRMRGSRSNAARWSAAPSLDSCRSAKTISAA
jgi:ATP-dependent DNA ligase